MSRYKILRTWSAVLMGLGAVSIIAACVGVFSWAVAVDGFWETLAVICFGSPIVLLVAAWPVALGQMLRAIADIGDAVTFDSTTSGAAVHR